MADEGMEQRVVEAEPSIGAYALATEIEYGVVVGITDKRQSHVHEAEVLCALRVAVAEYVPYCYYGWRESRVTLVFICTEPEVGITIRIRHSTGCNGFFLVEGKVESGVAGEHELAEEVLLGTELPKVEVVVCAYGGVEG